MNGGVRQVNSRTAGTNAGRDALRPITRQRLYEQLVTRLLDHIRDEGLRPGDRLPSERLLAQRLRVSRNSLKQATVVLEIQGVLQVRHGGGIYFARDIEAIEPVATLLDRRSRLPDVLDAREAIEVKLAELAAGRRTVSQLADMTSAIDAMAEAIALGHSGAQADEAFHEAVAAAAHSPVLAQFYRELAPAVAESRLESLRQPGRPARSLSEHRKIADAVRLGQPTRAAAAARRHVRTVRNVRLLAWTPLDETTETTEQE